MNLTRTFEKKLYCLDIVMIDLDGQFWKTYVTFMAGEESSYSRLTF